MPLKQARLQGYVCFHLPDRPGQSFFSHVASMARTVDDHRGRARISPHVKFA